MHTADPQSCWPLSCVLSVSCSAVCPTVEVNLLLVCLCSPLQLAPWSDPQSLCFPPPLSSSLRARPRWPACWPATLLREPWWAGRWTAQRWQRGSWPAQRRRRADVTAAAAPWVWARRAGWKESCTPARSSIMTTARSSPSAGASVRARGAGWSPGQELCVGGAGGTHLLLWSIWVLMFVEETKALCDREQHCCKVLDNSNLESNVCSSAARCECA